MSNHRQEVIYIREKYMKAQNVSLVYPYVYKPRFTKEVIKICGLTTWW